ncbi:uncharacterized protein LOC131262467 isoform X2 [Anopheles coustani]|uniref:uncharacterized protein LOC131262467 isoform X2 n=1 Tax=Anopheles coustani TaxID=139045 RepID=UPI0026592D4D|nr:uncharacterized protein LOC131262467 isoform X2 [Anopheles coustani]
MEYASFVNELATVGLNSPRCPPETPYTRQFEQSMEALLVNYELSDEDAYGQQPNANSTQPRKKVLLKTSSFYDDTSDRSCSESDQELKPSVTTYQRSGSMMDCQYSFDSGQGLSTRYDSSCSSRDDGTESNSDWNDFVEGLRPKHVGQTDQPDDIDVHGESLTQGHLTVTEHSINMSWQNEMQEMAEEIFTTNPPLNSSIFTSKSRSGAVKRTYDEANS